MGPFRYEEHRKATRAAVGYADLRVSLRNDIDLMDVREKILVGIYALQLSGNLTTSRHVARAVDEALGVLSASPNIKTEVLRSLRSTLDEIEKRELPDTNGSSIKLV